MAFVPVTINASDFNANVLVGAKLFLYAADGVTPQAGYRDITGGSAHTNPVICNAGGAEVVWLDDSLTYRLILQDAAEANTYFDQEHDPSVNPTGLIIYPAAQGDQALKTTDAVSFSSVQVADLPSGTSDEQAANTRFVSEAIHDAQLELAAGAFDEIGISLNATLRATTNAELAAAEVFDGRNALLKRVGQWWPFSFDASDVSAEVATDPLQGVLIPPASDTSGASGAWRLQYFGPVDVRMFAWNPNSASSVAASISAAIAFASSVLITDVSAQTNQVNITTRANVYITETATLRQAQTDDADLSIFDVSGQASGTIIHGEGTLDGRRSELSSSYAAPRDWRSVHVHGGVRNFTLSGLNISNFLGHGFKHLNGNKAYYGNLNIESCAKGFIFQASTDSLVENITISDTDSLNLAIFQHMMEIQGNFLCTFRNISINGWAPSGIGLDPFPRCFEVYRLTQCTFENIRIRGISANEQNSTAFDFDGIRDSVVSDIYASGYEIGILCQGSYGLRIVNPIVDGIAGRDAGTGIIVRSGSLGRVDVSTDGAREDTRYNAGARQLSIVGGMSRHYRTGVLIEGGIVNLTAFEAEGAVQDGISINPRNANAGWVPGSPAGRPNVTLTGCTARGCGRAGLSIDGCQKVQVNGGDYSGNGTRTNNTTGSRSGIAVFGTDTVGEIVLNGPILEDGQEYTITDGVSFEPGSADGNNQIRVLLQDAESVYLGQVIKIKDGAGAGSDVDGRVVAFSEGYQTDNNNRIYDEVLLEVASGTTLTSLGNVTGLTGRATADPDDNHILNGSGTSWGTQIRGIAFIRIQGQSSTWRRINRVQNDTTMKLEDEFPFVVDDAVIELLVCDMEGVPSQQHKVHWDAQAGEGSISGLGTIAGGDTVSDDFDINYALAYVEGDQIPRSAGGHTYLGDLNVDGDFRVGESDMIFQKDSGRFALGTSSLSVGATISLSIDKTPNFAPSSSSDGAVLVGKADGKGWVVGVGSNGLRIGSSAGSGGAISSYIDIAPGDSHLGFVNGTRTYEWDGNGNLLLGTTNIGSGAVRVIAMANGTEPAASAGVGQLCVSGGALIYIGSGGTRTVVAPS